VNFGISFAPLIPTEYVWAAAAVAAAIALLMLVSRSRGGLLRAAALALLVLALANPSLTREDRDPLSSVAVVVVDKSPSQSFGERAAQTEAARAAVTQRLGRIPGIEMRVVEAGQADGETDGTRLFSALNATLADVPPDRVAGAIFITDGRVHDVPADTGALGFAAPVHALISGVPNERDRRVVIVAAPRFGIVGQSQQISFRVEDEGVRSAPAEVKISRDGEPLDRRTVTPGQQVNIQVPVPHAGQNIIEIEAAPIEGELTQVNNRAVVTIDGVRDKLRVLLVSGEPHAGERTWRNLLKSDANVDLVHFTILRPPEKQDGTPINELSLIAFPTADLFGRKITGFDLIIFDRYSNQAILPAVYLDNIVRYVRDGGALMIAAGPDFASSDGIYYSPLGALSPAEPTGDVIQQAFQPAITAVGAKHPVTRGLPGADETPPAWSRWFRQVDATVNRGTNVLSGADNKPLLVLSREDKGRVALLLSDQMWLWARGFQGGGPHLALLRRLAHWLMKEPELEEEALRATSQGDELSIERQSLKDQIPPVRVFAPSGKEVTATLKPAEPGLSRADVKVSELGLYRVTDGTLTTLVNVGPENPREFQEVVSTTEKLRPLAEATGGTVRRIGTAHDSDVALPRIVAMHDSPIYGGSDYAAIKRTDSAQVTGIGIAPLAIGFLGLLFLLASAIVTWLYEGRSRGVRA
jgi:hypothetical protein